MFNNCVAYEVYHGCRWVYAGRDQDFLPRETIVAFGGKLGSIYVCPVRNVLDKRWCFALLAQPGFQLFRVEGKRVNGQPVMFSDGATLAQRDPTWSPPQYDHAKFQTFLTSLPDPTWRMSSVQNNPLTANTESEPIAIESKALKKTRRSSRTRKPIQRLELDVTPARKTKVPVSHPPRVSYWFHVYRK